MVEIQKLMDEFGRIRTFDAGEHLFFQGDDDSHLYMVRTGLLKACYVGAGGKEHIKSFLPEGSIIGSMVAMMDKEPCTFSLVAIEPGMAITLPYERIKDAVRDRIDLANALVDFLSAHAKRKERREYELLSLAPEDRYRLFLSTMAQILPRVTQADLAAYIGVTPQALSRLKRRIR